MATTPRYFSGESARRMENIRGLRRTQAVRQTGRVIGAGSIGATQGAAAGAAWLAAHPLSTYEADRQRFFEGLAATTPVMQAAIQRENAILNRELQRTLAQMEIAQDIMQKDLEASRSNQQTFFNIRNQQSRIMFDQATKDMDTLANGSDQVQGVLADYDNGIGFTPDLREQEMRTSRTSGGGGGGGGTSHEYERQRFLQNPRAIYASQPMTADMARELIAGVQNGSIAMADPSGAAVPASEAQEISVAAAIIQQFGGDGTDVAGVLDELYPNAAPQEKSLAVQAAGSYQANIPGTLDDFPSEMRSRVEVGANTLAEQRAQAVRQASTSTSTRSGGGAMEPPPVPQGTPPEAARALGLTRTELEAALADQNSGYTPDQADAIREYYDSTYEAAEEAMAEVMRTGSATDDETGMDKTTDIVHAANQIAARYGLSPEELFNKTKSQSPNQAIVGMEWSQVVSAANVNTSQRATRNTNEAIDNLAKVPMTGANDDALRAVSQDLENQRETFSKTADDAAALTNRVLSGDNDAELEVEAEARGFGSVEEYRQSLEQEQADEAFRRQGTTTMFGLEVPADEVPDASDIGGLTLYTWELANQYPAHPPLQQFIQDQMNSPEFAEWMSDRGYVGSPTPELFREFQREYRQVRRMNNTYNRRQRQLRQSAQERLGLTSEQAAGAAAAALDAEDLAQDPEQVYTRRGTRQYRKRLAERTREQQARIRKQALDTQPEGTARRTRAGGLGDLIRGRIPAQPSQQTAAGRGAGAALPELTADDGLDEASVTREARRLGGNGQRR
jgi:hypothetical protein